MTAIVGVLCKDGVVIGTDSSATFSQGQIRTVEQPFQKIEIIGDHIIVVGSGQVGLGQRFCEIVKNTWNDKGFKGSPIDVAKSLCRRAIEDFAYTSAPKLAYGALVAFPIESKPYLCEFSIADFQPELKTDRLWYCSMGSTQPITDTFLAFIRDIFWSEGPPRVADAVFSVVWTLDLAIQINPGGVNKPIKIAVLRRDRSGHLMASLLTDDDLAETYQSVDEMKKYLRSFKSQYSPDSSAVPSAPSK